MHYRSRPAQDMPSQRKTYHDRENRERQGAGGNQPSAHSCLIRPNCVICQRMGQMPQSQADTHLHSSLFYALLMHWYPLLVRPHPCPFWHGPAWSQNMA